MKPVYLSIIRFPIVSPKKALLMALVISIAAILVSLWRVRFETDLSDLLPKDDPAVVSFKDTIEIFEHTDTFYIILETDEENGTQSVINAAKELSAQLKMCELIKDVEFRLPDAILKYYRDLFLKYSFAFLPPSEIDSLKELLTPEAISASIERAYHLIGSGVPAPLQFLGVLDPLNIKALFTPKFKKLQQTFGVSPTSDWYYLGGSGKFLLVKIRGTKPASHIKETQELMSVVDEVLSNITSRYPHIKVSYTGAYPIAAVSAKLTKEDLFFTFITSIIGVLLLFWISFREPFCPLFSGVPLAAGILWTIGFCGGVIGRMTVVTTGFAAIIVGLGIDFAIHIYNLYKTELALGLSVPQAMEKAITTTIGGLIPATLTSCIAFFSFIFTGVRGFTQLGLLSTFGLIFTMLAMLIILPAIVILTDKGKNKKEPLSFYIPILSKFQASKPFWLVCINAVLSAAALLILFCLPGPAIKFKADVYSLRAVHERITRAEELLSTEFGTFGRSVFILFKDQDKERLISRLFKGEKILDSLLSQGKISGYRGIGLLLSDSDSQKKSIERLKEIDSSRVVKEVRDRLEEKGFQVNPVNEKGIKSFYPYLQWLQGALNVKEPLTISYLESQGRAEWLQLFIREKDGVFYGIIWSAVGQDKDTLKVFPEMGRLFAPLEGVLTGPSVLVLAMEKRIAESCRTTTAVAAICIIIYTLLWIRRVSFSVLSMVPMILGVLWMLAVMKILGLPVTLTSIVAIAMIFGLGIDDGIHLVHMYREEKERGPGAVDRAVRLAGRALILTSLTTIIGFGSLAMAQMKNMKDMGILCCIGMTTCLIQSLVFLPAILVILESRSLAIKKPGDSLVLQNENKETGQE